jgi:phosphoacetylglucosamine mutase
MTLTSPPALQAALAAAMAAQGPMSRCFVRPSGTENVVRIYAEAATQAEADALAAAAEEALKKFV